MLKIRMQRIGRINMPAYRIVVAEHTVGPKSGKFVEKLGSYNPKTKTRTINAERVTYWISVGAKPSDTVHNMLVTDGIIKGTKINVLPKNKNRKPVAAAAAADTAAPKADEPVAAEVVEETAAPEEEATAATE